MAVLHRANCNFCYAVFLFGVLCAWFSTADRWQLKTLIQSMKVDKVSLETELSIAICHLTSDKWQSKSLFLVSFDLCLSIVKNIFNCRLSSVFFVSARLNH